MRQVKTYQDGQELVITSNGRSRHLITWNELAPKHQADKDYLGDDEKDTPRFIFAYGGGLYDVLGSTVAVGEFAELGWQGYEAWGLWGGVVFKVVDHGDSAIVGAYLTRG